MVDSSFLVVAELVPLRFEPRLIVAVPRTTASRPPAVTSSRSCRRSASGGRRGPFTEPRPEELDPDLLIVWMARHVDRQRLPPNRTVVRFDFRDPKRRYWMVLEP